MKRVRMRDVSVRFGAVQALAGVDLSCGSGDVLMLVGPNGAGKSTLLHVLLGLVRPDAGTIEVDGEPRRVDNELKKSIGYLPEAVAFPDNLSGRQVLSFFARARGLRRRHVDSVLERVGLTHAARRAVRGYSRGMRQRLGLAQAILAEPELLVLDEPTGGLDQEGLAVLWSVLSEWREKDRLVILSAHDLALLERRVSRMSVLRAGKVIADGPPAGLRDWVSLPQRVHLQIAEHANGEVKQLAEAMQAVGAHLVARDADSLSVEVSPSSLLSVMDARASFPGLVVGMRVEEAPLDLVYEKLLEDG